MIVMKLGGPSVQNAGWIDGALSIIETRLTDSPVLVATALGDTTDRLEMIAENAKNGNLEAAQAHLDEITRYHLSLTEKLLTERRSSETKKRLSDLFQRISSLVKAISCLRECTERSKGTLYAFGELLSACVIASHAEQRGIRTELLDSRSFLITDENFTGAVPIFYLSNRLIREQVRPEQGKLIIVQGNTGSTEKGVTTILGKGGADYSAAVIGSALQADAVEIWSEGNGIMTSDPEYVSDARIITDIAYEEAAELAYFGAHVIHPSTIQPAISAGIPVFIRKISDPSHRGTRILPEPEGSGIRAIACKEHITLITVTSSRMLNAFGFLSRIFSIFERHMTSVDLIATSEVSVSMTIENEEKLEVIQQDLSEIGTVSVSGGMSIICLIGHELWKEPSFIARVFTTLNSVPVRLISLGSSDINLSVVVPDEVIRPAISRLHKEFFF